MKFLLCTLAFLGAVSSQASGSCPFPFGTENFAVKVQEAIASKKTCGEASDLAIACARGSSMDSQFVSAAMVPCEQRINAASSEVQKIVSSTSDLCTKKYAKSQGTLAISERAFCRLSVAQMYDDLLSDADDVDAEAGIENLE